MHLTIAGMAALGIFFIFFFMGYARGLLAEIISLLGLLAVMLCVHFLTPHVNSFLRDNTQLYPWLKSNCQVAVQGLADQVGDQILDATAQSQLIQSLPLPGGIKTQIEEGNSRQVYESLGVTDFFDYLSAFLAKELFDIACFVVGLLISSLAVGTLTGLLKTIARLPVLRDANRMAGGVLGLVKGFVVVWVCLVVLTLFVGTKWGEQGMSMVSQDTFLSFLYNRTIASLDFSKPILNLNLDGFAGLFGGRGG